MNVTVLNIQSRENEEYEVSLLIDGKKCSGNLTRRLDERNWGFDPQFYECLKSAPMAFKHVARVATEYHLRKSINFPVDLGNF